MTERDWLAATDPLTMLAWLAENSSERKLRLYACGYCRANWDQITEGHLKTLVQECDETAESSDSELDLQAAWHVYFARSFVCGGRRRKSGAVYASVLGIVNRAAGAAAPSHSEFAIGLIRCVFGNPFRPVRTQPGWLTFNVVSLAEGISQEKAFERLPILADALQDAGCEDAGVLEHCRGSGPHVRGCWVIDMILRR